MRVLHLRAALDVHRATGDCGVRAYAQRIWDDPSYIVEALTLDHHTPSIAYIVREPARQNIDPKQVAAYGFTPGPWLAQLKDSAYLSETIAIQGRTYDLAELREALLVTTPGESSAYVTDARLDDAALAQLIPAFQGCTTLVCESQYRHADLALAAQHAHLTNVQATNLAQRAGVQELVLFHLLDRYPRTVWQTMLAEARQIFPQTTFPAHWQLDG